VPLVVLLHSAVTTTTARTCTATASCSTAIGIGTVCIRTSTHAAVVKFRLICSYSARVLITTAATIATVTAAAAAVTTAVTTSTYVFYNLLQRCYCLRRQRSG
jgi:hypothetical protein